MMHALDQAVRALRAQSRYALAIAIMVALGVGSCTAMFSIVYGVLFTTLPYDTPDRPLFLVWHARANTDGGLGMWIHDYLTYRSTTRIFAAVTAFTTQGYNLTEGANPARLTCARLTEKLLPTLGVRPQQGRWFSETEEQSGASVVLLSNAVWRSRFGGNDQALGSTMHLDLQPYTIIGVMPEAFAFPPEGLAGMKPADCYVPARLSPTELALPNFQWIILATIKPGMTLAEAQSDASTIVQAIFDSYPAAVRKELTLRARVVALREYLNAPNRLPVLLFSVAVALLLFIGCANAANLFLTQLHARQRELAIRQALGATHRVMLRQLLVECILLALCGGAVGIPIAWTFLRVFVLLNAGGTSSFPNVTLDMPAFVFAATCSLIVGILFGVIPALQTTGENFAGSLINGSRGATGRKQRLRSVLVIVEVGMALVLLIGAGLLVRSLNNLIRVDAGLRTHGLLTFSVALPAAEYRNSVQTIAFAHRLIERLQSLPGVQAPVAGSSPPIGVPTVSVVARTDTTPDLAGFKPAALQIVSEEYHQGLGIPLKQGRLFTHGDTATGEPVTIISSSMARAYWPDRDPIGQHMLWFTAQRTLTVIGVVADVRQAGAAKAPIPTFYVPLEQSVEPARDLSFVVRSSGPLLGVTSELRAALNEVDPALPFFSLETLDDLRARSWAPTRLNTIVVGAFAGAALVLATFGIYAVISTLVQQSTREFGIRIAVGATASDLLRMVLLRGLRLASIGSLVGLCGALAMHRFLSSLLFEIASNDPETFAGCTVLVLAATALATLIPGLRALRVDPMTCLRLE